MENACKHQDVIRKACSEAAESYACRRLSVHLQRIFAIAALLRSVRHLEHNMGALRRMGAG